MRRRSRSLAPSIEPAEARVLLAGTVQTELVGDTFFIRGDDAANDVSIRGISYEVSRLVLDPETGIVHGEYVGQYVGWSLTGSDDTMISGPRIIPNHTRVVVELGGGDDSLSISGAGVLGVPLVGQSGIASFPELLIDMGWGADYVKLESLVVSGSTSIFTGTGDDVVELGDDVIYIRVWYPFRPVFNDLLISTGAGDDLVYVNTVEVTGNTSIYTGNGNDQVLVSRDDIRPYDGEPPIAIRQGKTSHFKSLTIKTYGGVDEVRLDHVWIEGDTRIEADDVAISTAHMAQTAVLGANVVIGDANALKTALDPFGSYRKDEFTPYVFDVIFTGHVTVGGAVGGVHIESTRALRNLAVNTPGSLSQGRGGPVSLGAAMANSMNGLRPGVDVVGDLSVRSFEEAQLTNVRAFRSARILGNNVRVHDVENQGALPLPNGRRFVIQSRSDVEVHRLSCERLVVATGSGDDDIRLRYVVATGRSLLKSGSGDDQVEVSNSSFLQPFVIDGEVGFDTRIVDLMGSRDENLIWENFEISVHVITLY
ncbi:MAG: hypothetical protein R3C18_08980 [Planctomycetaceae bacterium]